MSVKQSITVSCDNFKCEAVFQNDRSLLDARAAMSVEGWVSTIHYVGPDHKMALQDFCPEHRGQGFDWYTYSAKQRELDAQDEGV